MAEGFFKSAAEFLQEDNGGFSSTRLAFLIWVLGVLIVWMYDSIQSGALQKIDNSVVTLIGVLMTGKVVQKFKEADGNNTNGSSPP